MRRFARAGLTILVAVAGLTFPAPAARAGNFSGATGSSACQNIVNMSDGSYWTIYYSNVTFETYSFTDWAVQNVYKPIGDVPPLGHSSYQSHTDAVIWDDFYTTKQGTAATGHCGRDWRPKSDGSVLMGFVECRYSHDSGRCDQHYLHYNQDYTPYLSTTDQRGLACHELSHTLGVTHRSDTYNVCEKTTGPYPPWLGDHTELELKKYYP